MPKGVPIDTSTGYKFCPSCKENKPLYEFHESRHTVHGLQVNCKDCCRKKHREWRLKNLKKCADDQKKRREENPERYRDYMLKKNYGIPHGDYGEMKHAQDGKCAICRTSKPGGKGSFHVDHCHGSGKIRGLLCHRCNLMLGQAKDDIKVLEAAILYLKGEGA